MGRLSAATRSMADCGPRRRPRSRRGHPSHRRLPARFSAAARDRLVERRITVADGLGRTDGGPDISGLCSRAPCRRFAVQLSTEALAIRPAPATRELTKPVACLGINRARAATSINTLLMKFKIFFWLAVL